MLDAMFISRDMGLKVVFDFWVALSKFDDLDSTPTSDYERLQVALSFKEDRATVREHVSSIVVQRLPLMGPRVQLLPFLSSSPELQAFAEDIESAVWPLTQVEAATTRLAHLSKSEVCTILKLTPAKLTQLITAGRINWPDGSRQQRIAITEHELRLQGFSQTEILSLYEDSNSPVHRHDDPTPRHRRRRK